MQLVVKIKVNEGILLVIFLFIEVQIYLFQNKTSRSSGSMQVSLENILACQIFTMMTIDFKIIA